MRILAILYKYIPNFSGAAIQFHKLAKFFINDGHSVIVFTSTNDQERIFDYIDGVRIIRLPIGVNKKYRSQLKFMVEIIKNLILYRNQYDIIHLHGFGVYDIPLVLFAKLMGKRTLFQMTIIPTETNKLISKLYSFLSIKGLCLLDGLAAVSTPALNILKGYKTNVKNVALLTRGVLVDQFYPISDMEKFSLRESLGLKKDITYLCFVGSVVERKGIDILIDALDLLKSNNSLGNTYLIIVGKYQFESGDFTNLLEDQSTAFVESLFSKINNYGLKDNIIFVGLTDQVSKYLRASDIFVFPSRREGIPNVVLEAMATGLPCVISELNGIAYDIIDNYVDGIIVKDNTPTCFSKQIDFLLNDKLQRELMGNAAREKIIQNFTIQKIKETYLDFYKTILKI